MSARDQGYTAPPDPAPLIPRVGMVALVRNRRGLITAVDPCDGGDHGRVHLVRVESMDPDGSPADELLWEREPSARILEPGVLGTALAGPPMPPARLDELVRAARGCALSPRVRPDDPTRPLAGRPVAAPLTAAIEIEDFQLVPLVKALEMPRIALLIADDVGLGKTIEAGLIVSELLIQRRIKRVLVTCPASLCAQWRQELASKFGLSFEVVDREGTRALRRRHGWDANPWRSHPRVVTSYHYLKRTEVLEEFRAACRVPDGSGHLPWDLLIVDEAHHLAPPPLGEGSDLSRMLGFLAPFFEHRIFLSATPHNGHTRSFTGLLERLDPVRFTRTSEISPAQRERISEVVIRRLKREVGQGAGGSRFVERTLRAVPLVLGPGERALAAAFREFREAVRALVVGRSQADRLAGGFAVEVLGKRLLSCPVAFADSWHRYRQGLEDARAADASEVHAARRAAGDGAGDGRETDDRVGHAARVVGAWLQPLAERLDREMAAVDAALDRLGLGREAAPGAGPLEDARFDALLGLVDRTMRAPDGDFRDDERLVVFTEYRTTLESIARRLSVRSIVKGTVRTLHGGMSDAEREEVKEAFNDRGDPVRVLVATDAASEGLNLQSTARLLLHFDVPWNPSRLEQRNGRLDRHGQTRDVTVAHFATDDDADLAFLAHVVRKVDTIREELGSVGELFDAAFQRRFVEGTPGGAVAGDLDLRLGAARQRALFPRDAATGAPAVPGLEAFARELDLDGGRTSEVIAAAPAIGAGRMRFGSAQVRRGLDGLAHAAAAPFGAPATPWTVRRGPVPDHLDALILVTLEELAVNDLRETVHHWVRTLRLPVRRGTLEAPLAHRPPAADRAVDAAPYAPPDSADVERARALWGAVAPAVRRSVDDHACALEMAVARVLADERAASIERERQRFRSRLAEISRLMRQETMTRLERELADLAADMAQGTLFDNDRRLARLGRSCQEKHEELRRRREHLVWLRDHIERERRRVVDHLLPRRFTIRGGVRVLPVAIDVRLPWRRR